MGTAIMVKTELTTVTVYVPSSVRDRYHVNDYVDTLRLIAGGMSEHEIVGSWIGERGIVTESVKVIRYIIPDYETRNFAVDATLENLTAVLHEYGEDSVLIEFGTTTAVFA